MNNIKSTFFIQDLESLSGIKAHTIRIWEKRYDLLSPKRLGRNVRSYSLLDLQKILNVSLLSKYGQKISAIAKLSEKQISEQAKNIALENASNSFAVNTLVLAMLSFDEPEFERVYYEEIKKQTFTDVYLNLFVPLLNHIGILWQTDSIKPVHEHFISNLIYQKIVLQTAQLKNKLELNGEVYILFLPEGEIHELGLLFLNYVLRCAGKQTLYLGSNLPLGDLLELKSLFDKIVWITGYVMSREEEEKKSFLKQLKLLNNSNSKCFLFGEELNSSKGVRRVKWAVHYESFKDLVNSL